MSGNYLIKVSKVNGKYQINTKVPEQVLYAWKIIDYRNSENESLDSSYKGKIYYFNIDTPPQQSEFSQVKVIGITSKGILYEELLSMASEEIKSTDLSVVSPGINSFSYENSEGFIVVFERDYTSDFRLWEINEFSEQNSETDRITNIENKLISLDSKVNYIPYNVTSFVLASKVGESDITDGATFDVGDSLSNRFLKWTYDNDLTENPVAQNLKIPSRQSTAPISLENTARRYEFADDEISVNLSSNSVDKKTFTLSYKKDENPFTKSLTIYFKNRIYYGASRDPINYDSNFIKSLQYQDFADKEDLIKVYNAIDLGDSKYGFIAYPASWGEVKTWIISDFEVDVYDCGIIQFNNGKMANSIPYRILRTTQKGLGKIAIEIKGVEND